MSVFSSGNVMEFPPPFSLSVDKDGNFTLKGEGGKVYLFPGASEVSSIDLVKAAIKTMSFLADRQSESNK